MLHHHLLDSIQIAATSPTYPSDLKVYWKMDEASGNAVDIIAGNNALEQGTVPATTKGGLACRGPYSTSNYFSASAGILGTNLWYQLGSIWTIELDIWIDTTTASYAGIISLLAQVISGQNAEIEWSTNSSSLATRAYIVNTNPPLNYLVGTQSDVFSNGAWHNLALVSDGTNIKTYTDGHLNPSQVFTVAQMTPIYMYLGNWSGNNSALIGSYLKNVKIWNTAKISFPTVV